MNDAISHNIRSYRLPGGFAVEFDLTLVTGKAVEMQAAWSPRVPRNDEWARLRCAYRAARDDYLAGVARTIGGRVAVVET